jgi:hypothetical protein
MKKTSKILLTSLLVLALPTIALAYFKPATLIRGTQKIAVFSEIQAKTLFAQGFKLFGVNTDIGALTGPDISSPYIAVNDDVEYHLKQTFIDASTTIVSIRSPFLRATSSAADVVIQQDSTAFGWTSATSTVDLARLTISGVATTSMTISCGASAGPATAPSLVLLSSGSLATSTGAGGIIENNLTAALGGSVNGGTVAKIALTSAYPYFVCTVTPEVAAGVTNTANTFDGNIMVRISKTR